jgi:demethylsterigmatocystin 6-O-methyltransferase
VIGAQFYYLRHILHDWPLVPAQKILANLAVALSADSRILVDEMVLPDANVSTLIAMMDLAMMIPFAGAERTQDEWHELVDGVVDGTGRKLLVVEEVHEYAQEGHRCMLVLRLR